MMHFSTYNYLTILTFILIILNSLNFTGQTNIDYNENYNKNVRGLGSPDPL